MPQTNNVLSFVSVPNTEHGPRLTSGEGAQRWPGSAGLEEEAILRRIAEAALSATGAAGAALALRRNGAVVCLARAGEMAPPLGTRLDDSSGISGECLREGHALRCEDTETDTRVDADACRSLGLRSLAIASVREGEKVVGILEVFSPEPSTFSERHLEILRQLAELVVEGSESETTASRELVESPSATVETPPLVSQPVENPVHEAVQSAATATRATETESATHLPSLATTTTPLPSDVNIAAYMAAHEKAQAQVHPRIPKIVLIGLAMLVVAAMVGWYLGRRTPTTATTASPPQGVAAVGPASTPSPEAPGSAEPIAKPTPGVVDATSVGDAGNNSKSEKRSLTNAASLDRIANASSRTTKPIHVVRDETPKSTESDDAAPGLVVGSGDSTPNELVGSLLSGPASLPQRPPPISQGVEGGELETRVPAIYPPQARAVHQEGIVALLALVAEDGSVRDVKVVSGPPLLRGAAVDSVRRWKYKPFKLNGHAISAQTEVRLEFKLQ